MEISMPFIESLNGKYLLVKYTFLMERITEESFSLF